MLNCAAQTAFRPYALFGLPSIMEELELRNFWTCGDEAAEFFDVLTHDDRGSYYTVSRFRDGVGTHSAVKAESLGLLSFDEKSAYYVTRNGFNGRKREADRCRQINAMMQDIDVHGGNHEEVLPGLIRCLESSFDSGKLPRPNLFVETGRGVQIYYVLARSTPYRVRGGSSNEKGIKFFRDVEAGLSRAFEKAIAGIEDAKLDTCVYDFSRLSRIPGSFNQKSGTKCRLRFSSHDYYSLADLKLFCEAATSACSGRRAVEASPIKYDAMLSSRIRMLERLQKKREHSCVGSRDNMCFIFYNTATQIYGPQKAYDLTLEFNGRFPLPLPESEIAHIKHTVDNVVPDGAAFEGEQGYYPMKTSTVLRILNMSEHEVASIGVYAPSRMKQREDAKRRTKEKRDARDARICELYARGYNQAEVAKKVGCSARTVFSVLKRENISRGDLYDFVKSQFREVLDSKKEQFANNWLTSLVVLDSLSPKKIKSGFAAELGGNVAAATGKRRPCPPPLHQSCLEIGDSSDGLFASLTDSGTLFHSFGSDGLMA